MTVRIATEGKIKRQPSRRCPGSRQQSGLAGRWVHEEEEEEEDSLKHWLDPRHEGVHSAKSVATLAADAKRPER